MDESAREILTKDEILQAAAKKERQRLKRILKKASVPDFKILMLEPIIENVAWMKARLDDAREQIRASAVAIPYDNGGGQRGLRENPLFKGYEALWRSYMQGMARIFEALPEEMQAEPPEVVENPRSVLEIVRAKHKEA
jgi:hypothetical protein